MADNRIATTLGAMIVQNSTGTNPPHWNSLPQELRDKILHHVTLDKYPGWASLASVCKEWQLYIEKQNFHRLKLRASCLDAFERIVIRQRHLVRHIQLNIQLPRYTCHCCCTLELASWRNRNALAVGDGIWKLFNILSAWEPSKSLTLEFNAYSPSDSQHWFKDFYFNSDNTDADTTVQETRPMWHDRRHCWDHGVRFEPPPPFAILRIFGYIGLVFRERFPQVNAVTCFVIRRQFRRRLAPPVLQLILNSLCRLEHLIYEPWRPTAAYHVMEENEIVHLVTNGLPKTLKKVLVFEDYNEAIVAWLDHTYPGFQMRASSVQDAEIGAAFANRSLDLEELSVSYMVNAEAFFQACEASWTWKHLQSLALTSQLLGHTGWLEETNALLRDAGNTALRMPKLKTMVLWHGEKETACAFMYHVHRGDASITWRGTWDLELSRAVTEAWQRVALKFHSRELEIRKQQLKVDIGSHGDAIHHLDLPCQVVSPASLWQIRRELCPS